MIAIDDGILRRAAGADNGESWCGPRTRGRHVIYFCLPLRRATLVRLRPLECAGWAERLDAFTNAGSASGRVYPLSPARSRALGLGRSGLMALGSLSSIRTERISAARCSAARACSS